MGSEVVQECIATMTIMSLSEVIQNSVQDSICPDLGFLSEQWLHDLNLGILLVSLSSRSDHTLISMRFFNATIHYRKDLFDQSAFSN